MYGLSPPSVSRSTGHPKNSASSSSQRMSPKKPVGREKSASRSISDAAVSSPRAADPNRRSCVTPCLLQIAASCESSNWTMLYSLRALKPGQQNTRSRAFSCNGLTRARRGVSASERSAPEGAGPVGLHDRARKGKARRRAEGSGGRAALQDVPRSERHIRSRQYPGRCFWCAKATTRISSLSALYTTMYGKRWRTTRRVSLWNGEPRWGFPFMKSRERLRSASSDLARPLACPS